MFVPKTFNLIRLGAIGGVLALVAVATAFNFDEGRATDATPIAGVAPRNEQIETAASSPLRTPLSSAGLAQSTDSDDSDLVETDADDTDAEDGDASGDDVPVAVGPALDEIELISIGEFIAPVEVLARPGDDRTYVVELMGNVMVVDGDETESVLDVSEVIGLDGEQGLLGAAFHPDEPFLYVHYSDLDGDTVIAEFEIITETDEDGDETEVVDFDSLRQVLTVDQPYNNHNGGELAFGPDGLLYIGLGDGGLADDPRRTSLDLSSPLGKILRIDPLESDDAPYTVPDDNPFVAAQEAGAEEIDTTIWSFGLRNPWRFSFDGATGNLWIADVGQNAWEEVNFGEADEDGLNAGRGLSYGWSAYEGFDRFNDDQFEDGHEDPFITYAREDGLCSISGGAVYRGAAISALTGYYVYGDYCTGQIFAFDTAADEDDREIIQIAETPALVAIAEGADGELYAVSVAGEVARLG